MNEEGLQRFFGSLEAKIMDKLWEKGKLTIKQLHEMLNRGDPISLNAVMTVMIRLADKGILLKESTGGGRNRLTFFSPVQDRDQFIAEQTKVITDGLIEDFGANVVVNNFMQSLDKLDDGMIDQLEQKLMELKNKR